MQKIVLVCLAVVGAALAAPQHEVPPAQILRHESNVGPDGYHFVYETSDGTSRQEQGQLKQVDEEHQALEVSGNYRYLAPDGLVYSVTYTANEHGFQPHETVEHQGQAAEAPQGDQYQQFQQ